MLNRPEEVAAVFRHAVAHDAGMGSGMGMGDDERVRIARRMREALVKGAVVGGLPKVNFIYLFIEQCMVLLLGGGEDLYYEEYW